MSENEKIENEIHRLYRGVPDDRPPIIVDDGLEENPVKKPIVFKMQKPRDPNDPTKEWDQTGDAANNMRYAATLGLPTLSQRRTPRRGTAIICGGAPSIKDHLSTIQKLASDPLNNVFAINWTHTWLIQNSVTPNSCVFFEIDTEPDTVLKNAHPDCTYYICSHCHARSFDSLRGFKRVLWHSHPNSEPEKVVRKELFADTTPVGGGVGTFLRTVSVGLMLGYRDFELFGCDSSYPESEGTHVKGYETVMKDDNDGFNVYAQVDNTQEVRRFRTVGYLALQAEEFKAYCQANHQFYTLRVNGDSLLRFMHEKMWPEQYTYE